MIVCVTVILIALLVREGVKKQYCANDVITYTCSSLFLELGEEASLMWDMDLGEDENSTIDVGYSDTSRIGITSEYNNFNIHTALTDYNLGEYLASTLKVIVNSDTNTFTIEVRCTVGNLLPVVDILQAAFLREGNIIATEPSLGRCTSRTSHLLGALSSCQ